MSDAKVYRIESGSGRMPGLPPFGTASPCVSAPFIAGRPAFRLDFGARLGLRSAVGGGSPPSLFYKGFCAAARKAAWPELPHTGS